MENSTPLHTLDGMYGSGIGMVGMFVGDMYADRVYDKAGAELLKNPYHASVRDSYVDEIKRRKRYTDKQINPDPKNWTNTHTGNKSGMWGWTRDKMGYVNKNNTKNVLSNATSRFGLRRAARATLGVGGGIPKVGGWMKDLIDSPEEMINRRARNLTIRDFTSNPRNPASLRPMKDSSLMGKLTTARNIKDISNFGFGVFAATIGYDVAKAGVNGLKTYGDMMKSRNFSMSTREGFVDSNMAHTTRQRALRAIQASGGAYRRAIGNEASFLKPGNF